MVKKIVTALTLAFLAFVFVNKVYAAPGCCIASFDRRSCLGPVPPVGCPSAGLKICDTNNNKTDPKVDANNNGIPGEAVDVYNPDCWIPIVAPESVKITDFGKFFSGAVGFLLLIAFIASFLYLILGGLSWVTSGGDKAAVETARNKILAALIGLIIVAATWALFQLVGGAIGFNILKGFTIPRLF